MQASPDTTQPPFLPPRVGASRFEQLGLVESAPSVPPGSVAALRRLVRGGLQGRVLGESPVRILGGVRECSSGNIVGYEHGFSIRERTDGRFSAVVSGPGNQRAEVIATSLDAATKAILEIYSHRGPL